MRPGVPCEAVLRAEGPDAVWRWRSFGVLWKFGKIEDQVRLMLVFSNGIVRHSLRLITVDALRVLY